MDADLRDLERAQLADPSIRPQYIRAMARAGRSDEVRPQVGDRVLVTETKGPCPANGDACQAWRSDPWEGTVREVVVPEKEFMSGLRITSEASLLGVWLHVHDRVVVKLD